MAIDPKALTDQAVAEFAKEATTGSNKILAAVKQHVADLAVIAAQIEFKNATKKISVEDASDLLEINRLALESVYISAKGQAKVVLERAVNAALKVIFDAIKAATGIVLA